MTFKHKLSSRLALLKDRVVLASLAGLVTATIVACELPVRATDPGSTIADLLVSPKTLTLRQNATADFTAVGFMSTGDSASVAVSWSVTAGSIIDTSSSGKRHYGHYKAGPNPGQYKAVATGNPGRATARRPRHRGEGRVRYAAWVAGRGDFVLAGIRPCLVVAVMALAVAARVDDTAAGHAPTHRHRRRVARAHERDSREIGGRVLAQRESFGGDQQVRNCTACVGDADRQLARDDRRRDEHRQGRQDDSVLQQGQSARQLVFERHWSRSLVGMRVTD